MDDLQRLAGASAQAAFWDDVRRRQSLGRRSAGDALHFSFFAGIGVRLAFRVCTVVLVVVLFITGLVALFPPGKSDRTTDPAAKPAKPFLRPPGYLNP